MSEAHSLRITLTGPGGHGAMPDGPGRRHPGHGRAGRAAGRGGRGAALRGRQLRVQRRARSAPARRSTSSRPRPGSRAPCARSRAGQREEALDRLRGLLCASVADARASQIELETPEHTPAVVNDPAVTDLVEARPGPRLGAESGAPHAALVPERRRERVPRPPARVATSSWVARRRTARAACTTARPSPSRTPRCGSGPASWCAAPWRWPRRESPRGNNGPMTALRPLRHRRQDGARHRREPRHRAG